MLKGTRRQTHLVFDTSSGGKQGGRSAVSRCDTLEACCQVVLGNHIIMSILFVRIKCSWSVLYMIWVLIQRFPDKTLIHCQIVGNNKPHSHLNKSYVHGHKHTVQIEVKWPHTCLWNFHPLCEAAHTHHMYHAFVKDVWFNIILMTLEYGRQNGCPGCDQKMHLTCYSVATAHEQAFFNYSCRVNIQGCTICFAKSWFIPNCLLDRAHSPDAFWLCCFQHSPIYKLSTPDCCSCDFGRYRFISITWFTVEDTQGMRWAGLLGLPEIEKVGVGDCNLQSRLKRVLRCTKLCFL